MSKEIFWTDLRQASERIGSSIVMYDGKAVYVSRLIDGLEQNDGDHRAIIVTCDPTKEESRKKLNSPKFKRFRELPTLGWFNCGMKGVQGVIFSSRQAITTRTHGLNSSNTVIQRFGGEDYAGEKFLRNSGDYNLMHFIYDAGFDQMQRGEYPSMEATLLNIVPGSAIAISNKWCVNRDSRGIRWLYRNSDVVGLFTGVDTLNLLNKYSFLREEVMDDAVFTINTIREF